MEEFWIINSVLNGIYSFPLHYIPHLNIAEEKVGQLSEKFRGSNVEFTLTHMVLSGDEFIKVNEGEVEYCTHCDNIIKIKGRWRFHADEVAYESSNGQRCGRCKGEFVA